MILGIYFNERNFKRLYNKKLEAKMNFLAEEAVKEEVQVLAFSPLNIDWIAKNINGLIYNALSKSWELTVYPFPDIIYDRATFLKNEKEVGGIVRERLSEECKIPFINNKSYFNKWETHEVLSMDSAIINYLPYTEKYCHPYQLLDILDKYNSVYIKDSGGRLGKNIFKLQKADGGLYILSYQISGTKYSDKLTLQEVHSKFAAERLLGKNIIIQQGIDVAFLDLHPFDVRILAQKNELTNWEVVDKSIRIASPGSIVTNISSGGKVEKFDSVIPLLFSNSAFLSDQVDILVIRVCEALERKYGMLGELGIDAAIDKSGRVWLIEVNGKPAKLCIYHSSNLELINRSCRNIVRYSKLLFKQRNEKEILCGGSGNCGNEV
ncbi:YheC/YheD family protein [Candidatus Clostridium stratigraminis]|uniref:YheC/YheD family protein n=1 Tax=Candidatus Clostridium stratigraminis TaxID=3381661 RepID=A0ABW8T5Z6_9CLOT